jgi:hypothetical protein
VQIEPEKEHKPKQALVGSLMVVQWRTKPRASTNSVL